VLHDIKIAGDLMELVAVAAEINRRLHGHDPVITHSRERLVPKCQQSHNRFALLACCFIVRRPHHHLKTWSLRQPLVLTMDELRRPTAGLQQSDHRLRRVGWDLPANRFAPRIPMPFTSRKLAISLSSIVATVPNLDLDYFS